MKGTVLALVLMFAARPLATLLATIGTGFSLPERAVLGWAGLRGAVPVVLATFPVIAGVDGSRELFNIVFFAVVLSTLVQGATFEAFARRLGVTTSEAALPAPLIEPVAVARLGAEVVEVLVNGSHAVAGRRVRELGLPRDALLNIIIRGDQAIPPRGSTVVLGGDRLHVLVRQEVAVEFRALLRRWRDGPMAATVRPSGPAGSTLFQSRPWRIEDGANPARPDAINGVAVVDRLRTRRDVAGALVALADGRYAVTGPVVSIGPPRASCRRAAPAEGRARRRGPGLVA